jgi:DNA repair protein RecN (Recombination protein N)
MTERPSPPPGLLVELGVHDLGIIHDVSLVLGPGMTALTGETGAGKTLLVGAIELLLGGRADPTMVRSGAREAVIEGRFVVGDDEVVLTRAIPADGRSRAYIDGRMATAAALAERAGQLVDLHGQHAHQTLLATSVQRAALDRFAGVDLEPLAEARRARRQIEAQLAELGGDAGSRAREADLLRFQLEELDRAALVDPDEDRQLDEAETLLADATAHRAAAASVAELLSGDGGAVDLAGRALAELTGRAPFQAAIDRLHAAQADLADLAAEVRAQGEGIEDDEERLAWVRERRQLLVDLRRKYGTAPRTDAPEGGAGTLADVIGYHHDAQERLRHLLDHDATVAELDAHLADAVAAEAAAAAVVGAARRRGAAPLATAVEGHLAALAMPSARFEVGVGGPDPGDDVRFSLAANVGSASGPIAKVASGGELARTMLALRLVLSAAPPVLVFDEVDAGIGGSAALAVGTALAALGRDHQVLVVTHLAQVAACADHQLHVQKRTAGGTTATTVSPLDHEARVVEVARMLAGTPESERVQDAADELLRRAAGARGR